MSWEEAARRARADFDRAVRSRLGSGKRVVAVTPGFWTDETWVELCRLADAEARLPGQGEVTSDAEAMVKRSRFLSSGVPGEPAAAERAERVENDWRGLSGDPFAVPTREVAVGLWSVADELKTYLGLEAARLRGGATKRAAGEAFLRVGKALDELQREIERARCAGREPG